MSEHPLSEERLYEIYRRNIEHEDHLINHRLSWLMVAQSFLLAACVSSGRTPFIIKALGVSTCIVSYVSIFAAFRSINLLKEQRSTNIPEGYPPLVGANELNGLIATNTRNLQV